jgi:iron complex outermembrane receptor protein
MLAAESGLLRILVAVWGSASALCLAQDIRSGDLGKMDLDDLLKVKVTSVSKKEQDLSRAAAAVFVIGEEDIRRSGATSLPDLLRMAPGVDVEQIDNNAWAISIRGFNSRYSNKVLVLIDGRSVYTSSFSGVFWEQIGIPLENIDRIEVIRGPGATVWGANAVNGVISIFTKHSRETQGGTMAVSAGSQPAGVGFAQYGGEAGKTGTYRAFGQYFNTASSVFPDGSRADDHWGRAHGGFRSDWELSGGDELLVEGDLFTLDGLQTRRGEFMATPLDRIFNQSLDAAGGDLLARWSHRGNGGSQSSLQTYYDTYRRTDFGVPEVQRTFDVDFQQQFAVAGRHEIVWGLGYRVADSALSPGYPIAFTPPSRKDKLYSAFLQDEIRVSNSLWLTIGSKLEHNPYTGFQTEPSARIAWHAPASRHTLWAAASQALRQPARADTAISADVEEIPINPGLEQVVRIAGNPQIQNEQLRDFELGYRSELTSRLSLDAATFLSFYRHLETVESQAPVLIAGSPAELEIVNVYGNLAHAVDYGGEVSINWQPLARWRVSPGYSYLHATLRQDPPSQGLAGYDVATGFPQNLFQVRSLVNLSRRMEFNQSLYYTARLPGGSVPEHARLDLRIARRIGESVEISVVGQNLLRPHTTEYGDSNGIVGTEVVRSVYGRIVCRF